MASIPEDIRVKVATSTAQDFVETYYPALNNIKRRSEIANFYIKSANTKSDIIFNGNAISSPNDLQKLFQSQIHYCYYDVKSFDAHILNCNYNLGSSSNSLLSHKDGKKASVIVLVSGTVKYWKEGEDGDIKGFTESVVLVPNLEALSSKSTKTKTRKWLISSQNFRLVMI